MPGQVSCVSRSRQHRRRHTRDVECEHQQRCKTVSDSTLRRTGAWLASRSCASRPHARATHVVVFETSVTLRSLAARCRLSDLPRLAIHRAAALRTRPTTAQCFATTAWLSKLRELLTAVRTVALRLKDRQQHYGKSTDDGTDDRSLEHHTQLSRVARSSNRQLQVTRMRRSLDCSRIPQTAG